MRNDDDVLTVAYIGSRKIIRKADCGRDMESLEEQECPERVASAGVGHIGKAKVTIEGLNESVDPPKPIKIVGELSENLGVNAFFSGEETGQVTEHIVSVIEEHGKIKDLEKRVSELEQKLRLLDQRLNP